MTFFIDSVFDIDHLHKVSIGRVLFFSIIWAILIYISLKIFKSIPAFLRQPLLRILLWSPLVILDLTNDRTEYSETPSYLLYLFNEGLLPISSFLNHMADFQDRLIYSNLTLWIEFAVIQAMILFCADRIMKIKNKNSGSYAAITNVGTSQ